MLASVCFLLEPFCLVRKMERSSAYLSWNWTVDVAKVGNSDFDAQDEEVASYVITLIAPSFYQNLQGQVSVYKSHEGNVLFNLRVDRIKLNLMESKALLKSMSIRRPGLQLALA